MLDVGLAKLEEWNQLHEASESTESSVGSDDQVALVGFKFLGLHVQHGDCFLVEIHTDQFVTKVELDVGVTFQFGEEYFVQVVSANGVNTLKNS
jgi:hypothetical protein